MIISDRIVFRRGFTLIELMVVIAIIGLLSSIVLSSLNTARVKGNDSRRISELRQIQTAVELYYNDNGHYPNSNGTWTSFDSSGYGPNPIVSPNASNLTAALSPYIGAVIDPRAAALGGDAGFLYIGGGENYCILGYRIPENMNNFSASQIPPRCGAVSNGSCTDSPNAIYIGAGAYASGC